MLLEMGNDDSPDSLKIIKQSRLWVLARMIEAGLITPEDSVTMRLENLRIAGWRARQIGQVETLPAEEIAANFHRYQNRYGTFEASAGISAE